MITCELTFNLNLSHSSGREYNLIYFQIHWNIGRHNESSTVWTIPDLLLNVVFRRSLHYVGKYCRLIYKIFNDVYFYVFTSRHVKHPVFSLQIFRKIKRNSSQRFETGTAWIRGQALTSWTHVYTLPSG